MQKLKKELLLISVCIVIAYLGVFVYNIYGESDGICNNSKPSPIQSVPQPHQAEVVLQEVIERNSQALSEFYEKLAPETESWFEAASGTGVDGFREKIGSFGFIVEYLTAWKDGVREKYVKQVVHDYAGLFCETGLEKAESIYKNYCKALEENLQKEIETLYGDKLGDANQNNDSLIETYRQELDTVFANQHTELLGSVVGDTISIAFAPFAIDGLASIIAGTVAGGPVGWIFAIGSVALDAYQLIVKRPAELDARKTKFIEQKDSIV